MVYTIHGVSNTAASKGQRYGLRHLPALQKHGKLKVCVEGKQVKIQMCNEAVHGFSLIAQPGSFNVHSPLRKAAQEIQRVKDRIGAAIEKIRNFFKFKWELPKIPLPHFSITGKFSLNPPQVPHLSIDWYKKAMADGMILSSPTVLPAANGSLRGFGDAGPEAVVGVSALRSMIGNAVSAAIPRNSFAKNLTVIMEMNGSEFARTTVPYIDTEVKRVGVKLVKM